MPHLECIWEAWWVPCTRDRNIKQEDPESIIQEGLQKIIQRSLEIKIQGGLGMYILECSCAMPGKNVTFVTQVVCKAWSKWPSSNHQTVAAVPALINRKRIETLFPVLQWYSTPLITVPRSMNSRPVWSIEWVAWQPRLRKETLSRTQNSIF